MPVIRSFATLVLAIAFSVPSSVPAIAQDKEQPEFKAPALKPITEKLPGVFAKPSPENVDDLRAIQDHVATLTDKIIPTVVSVRIGPAFGSGVIVSKDGYVLTAGHVSGAPNRDVTVFFHNGKTAKGKTLGGNHGIDSGMIKITTPGDYPFAEIGDSSTLKKGEFLMVVAHPGGFKLGRSPVLRLGRLLNTSASALTSDCILVGGDSGGPLFDMHGRVVGINSRIGQSLNANIHVPSNPFRDSWDKLAKGEVFGGKLGTSNLVPKGGPWLGVQTESTKEGTVIRAVTPNSPADKAGLKADDILLKFNGKDLVSATALSDLVRQRKAGDEVTLDIQRGDTKITLKLELGKRPG